MVTKKTGFRAPYRSLTFRDMITEIYTRNGVLSSSGPITSAGGSLTISPYVFNQNGLIVEDDTVRVVVIPLTIIAPFMLVVSATTSSQVDDLVYSFISSPRDLTSNSTVLAFYDGIEWKMPDKLSINDILETKNNDRIDSNWLGPISGLRTTDTGPTYENTVGIIVDKFGQKTKLSSVISFNKFSADPEVTWTRVDRIVYRRPKDTTTRIGERKFLLGGTVSPSTQLIAGPTVNDATKPAFTVKSGAYAGNLVNILTVRGFGENFKLWIGTVSANRSVMTIPSIPIAGITATDKDVSLIVDKTNGDCFIAYTFNSDIFFVKVSAAGAVLSGPVQINTEPQPCVNPKMVRDASGKFLIIYQALMGPNNSQIHFASCNSVGATITGSKAVTSTADDLIDYDIFSTNDLDVYIAYEDSVGNSIHYLITNNIGDVIQAPTEVSSNTESTSYGVLSGGAIAPRIFVTENKSVFITFFQLKDIDFGITIWKDGKAYQADLFNSLESINAFDIAISNTLNDIYLTVSNLTNLKTYRSIVRGDKDISQASVVSTLEVAANASTALSILQDLSGSLLVTRSNLFTETYSNVDGPQTILHIGPKTLVGTSGTVVLAADQVAFSTAGLTHAPLVDERITVSGAANVANNVTKTVVAISVQNYNSVGEYTVLTFESEFNSFESPAVSAVAQFSMPNGMTVNAIKTVSEISKRESLSLRELDSDILIARIDQTGLILNYQKKPVYTGVTPTVQHVVVHGSSEVDWELTAPSKFTIATNFFIIDLLNNLNYTVPAGGYTMLEDGALCVSLNPDNLITTPSVHNIESIPWSDNIHVLGVIKNNIFTPVLLNSVGGEDLSSGETIVIGENLSKATKNRLGITSDTTFTAYPSTTIIAANDNYPTAIGKLDLSLSTAKGYANQDRTIDLVRGDFWSWNLGTTQLTLSANAFIQVPGLTEARNTILAQSITLDADGKVAYVTLNRTAGVSANLTVNTAVASALVLNDNIFIIARRIGSDVIVGHSMKLIDGESKKLYSGISDQNKVLIGGATTPITEATSNPLWATRGSPIRNVLSTHAALDAIASIDKELDRFFGQLKITPHPSVTFKAIISGVDKTMLDASILSQELRSLVMSFDGAVINFSTGVILASDDLTPLGTNFTPFAIPANQYFWYGVSLLASTVAANNSISAIVLISQATAADVAAGNAPYAALGGDKKIGQIRIFNNAGAITVNQVRQLGVGSGSGDSGEATSSSIVASGFKSVIIDEFSDFPNSADSKVNNTDTKATFDAANKMYSLKCDKSKTFTTIGTAYTISGAPSFIIAAGDIIYSGGKWRKIASITTQTTGLLDAAFPVNLTATVGMISQAVHSVDLVNYGSVAQKTRLRDFFPSTAINQVNIAYDDSYVTADAVPDYVDQATVAVSASNSGLQSDVGAPLSSTFADIFERPAAPNQINNYSLLNNATKERLFLTLFCNPNNATVTTQANALKYECSVYEKQVLLSGGSLWSSVCWSDSSVTPINCTNPATVLGKSRITFTNSYVPSIGGPGAGELVVSFDGQTLPRYYTGVVGAYYLEIDPFTIELWIDVSGLSPQRSIHVRRQVGTVDTSSVNSLKISAIYDVIVGSPAQLASGVATHSSWASGITALPVGGTMYVLKGTYIENFIVNKECSIKGQGRGTLLIGNITFDPSSDFSDVGHFKVQGNISFQVGADGIFFRNIFQNSAGTLSDLGSGNSKLIIQE